MIKKNNLRYCKKNEISTSIVVLLKLSSLSNEVLVLRADKLAYKNPNPQDFNDKFLVRSFLQAKIIESIIENSIC